MDTESNKSVIFWKKMRLFQEVVVECVSVTNRNKIFTQSSDFIRCFMDDSNFLYTFYKIMFVVKNSGMKGFIGTYLIKNKYS